MNKPRISSLISDLIVFCISSVVIFSLLEVVFRVKAYYDDRKILHNALATNLPVSPGEVVTIGKVVLLSDNDRLIYELKPGLDVILGVYDIAVPLRTNINGFRDREYAELKPPGTVRIIGVGDSFMFGLGVDGKDNYLSRIESALNSTCRRQAWDVINLAVPGYNTVQEVEMLRSRGLRFDPDIVIVGYYGNDFSLPFFIRNEEEYFTLRKSFLQQYIARSLNLILPKQVTEIVPAPDNHGQYNATGQPADDPDAVPGKYRYMVGWEPFEGALKDLKHLSDEYGFQVIFVALTDKRMANDLAALKLAGDLGFVVIDTYPEFEEHMRNKGIDKFLGSEFSVGKSDPHPSVLGHKLAAEIILGKLSDNGMVAGFTCK